MKTIQELNDKKIPIVRIDNSLEKYKTQYDLKYKLVAYFNLENKINCH